MSSKKTFAVAMIGIPEHERNILNNIFKLSLYRDRTYTIAAADEAAQIVLVNADDPHALAEWQALHDESTLAAAGARPGVPPPLPAVMIAQDNPPAETPYHIRRPFVASRVLKVLDQLTGNKPGLSPDEGLIHPTTAPDVEPIALVVDDSRTVRKQIQLELKGLGIRVDTADSGEDALELLDLNRYDLIFLDIILPGIDGYEVCKYIKRNKSMQATPVIIISGKSSTFDRVKAALAGCDTYLVKPVKTDIFHKIVQKYLKK